MCCNIWPLLTLDDMTQKAGVWSRSFFFWGMLRLRALTPHTCQKTSMYSLKILPVHYCAPFIGKTSIFFQVILRYKVSMSHIAPGIGVGVRSPKFFNPGVPKIRTPKSAPLPKSITELCLLSPPISTLLNTNIQWSYSSLNSTCIIISLDSYSLCNVKLRSVDWFLCKCMIMMTVGRVNGRGVIC